MDKPPVRLRTGQIVIGGEAGATIPQYASVPDWCALAAMSRTRTYVELAAGNLRAKKLGKRIVIDVLHGLAWIASLPNADIRVPSLAGKTATA